MIVDDGGSAFPLPLTEQGGTDWNRSGGMSLRDYFAAKALPGVIRMCAEDTINYNQFPSYEDYFAYRAYRIADAMLKARDPSTSP